MAIQRVPFLIICLVCLFLIFVSVCKMHKKTIQFYESILKKGFTDTTVGVQHFVFQFFFGFFFRKNALRAFITSNVINGGSIDQHFPVTSL